MTGPAGFDRTLSDWLDDSGAQDIPPRVIDAAIHEARHTRRARPLPDLITRWLPMSTNFAAALPLPLARPRSLARLGPVAILIALTLLALALIGAALLAVGVSPSPPGAVHNGLIAFDSNGEIWLVNGDGSGLRQLTHTTDHEVSPQWSQDGARLLYWASSTGAQDAEGEIRVTDPDGGLLRTLTAPDGFGMPCCAFAIWSPDGRTLLASAWEQGGTTDRHAPEILLFDVETGIGRQLDVGMPAWGAAWSPNASRVVFASWDVAGDKPLAIWSVAPDGGGLQRISAQGRIASVGQAASIFSPDGSTVYLGEEAPGRSNGDVVAAGFDGTPERVLVGGPTNDLAPTVSPDGRWLAFVRPARDTAVGSPTDPSDLYIVPAVGGDPVLVSGAVKTWAGWPIWSPDSTRLVTSSPSFDQQIVFAIDTSVPPVQIPSPGNTGYLSWRAIRR